MTFNLRLLRIFREQLYYKWSHIYRFKNIYLHALKTYHQGEFRNILHNTIKVSRENA